MTPYQTLDRQRQVHHADVLLDSNVLRSNDDEAERRLHALADRLVAHPGQGNFWFSLMSLSEIIAPANASTRIDLLSRFRNLYLRFGDRVRFMRSLNDNVRAECLRGGIPSAPASVVDEDIVQSIANGELVGLLKVAYEDWRSEKQRLRTNYEQHALRYQGDYAARPELRGALEQVLPAFFSNDGLDACDDVALELIVESNLWTPLASVKERHGDYPCIWTFSLLARLAQFAQTLTDHERTRFPESLQQVVAPHANDFIDADIAGTGGRCGMMITNDTSLIAKLNRLYDGNLVRLQAFTVADALAAYTPPTGSAPHS